MENRKTNIHQMISILVHRHTCQLLPPLLNQFSYKSKSPFKIAAFSGRADSEEETSFSIYPTKLVLDVHLQQRKLCGKIVWREIQIPYFLK